MSSNLEALQEQVFHLSPADRARLLDRLITSLDVDDEAEAAWDSLAEERERELTSGMAEAVPVDAVIARLFRERAARGRDAAFDKWLQTTPDVAPDAGDELGV